VKVKYAYYHLAANHYRVDAGGAVEKWFDTAGWRAVDESVTREWLQKYTWRDDTAPPKSERKT
jgi:O-methyltransferase involved in polyketide biosynthesis